MSGSDPDVGLENLALIVWDMQNGISKRAFNVPEIVANVNLLLDAAHMSSGPVIVSQHTGLGHEYQSKYGIYSARRRGVDPKAGVFMAEGTQDWKLLDGLAIGKEDIVVKKHTPSLFGGQSWSSSCGTGAWTRSS